MAARKNYTAAQIINGLRRAEVGLAKGKSMKEVIRDLVQGPIGGARPGSST